MKLICTLLFTLASAGVFAQKVDNEKNPANVYFDKGKLIFESNNKAFKLWFDNRIYIAAAYYSSTVGISGLSSKLNKDFESDDGKFRFRHGMVVRCARFAVKGTLYEKWNAELDRGFAYNDVEIKDMYIGYYFNEHTSIKAGNFKEPMSMEWLTSCKYLMNRSALLLSRCLAADAKRCGQFLPTKKSLLNRALLSNAINSIYIITLRQIILRGV